MVMGYHWNYFLFLDGKLAQSLQEATHIVISNSPDANIEGMDKQNIVSAEVFFSFIYIARFILNSLWSLLYISIHLNVKIIKLYTQ